MSRRPSPLLVGTAFMFLSGAAAVADEVVWARMLREVFGSTVEAVSTVLAVYFAGLATGALIASRVIPTVRRPARTYRLLEVAIAVAALSTLPLIRYLAAHVPVWEAQAGGGASWETARVMLAACVLLPATIAMGATLAFMVRVLAAGAPDGRLIGRLYAANTFGGVAGAFAAEFFAIGNLGCRLTVVVACAINLGVAFAARWLPDGPAAPADDVDTGPAVTSARSGVAVLVASAVAGGAALAAEVIWTRVLVFGFGTSAYAFATILVAVLISIAVGGAAYGWAPPPRRLEHTLGIVLLLEGIALALSAQTFRLVDLPTLHGTATRMALVLPRPITWPLLWIGLACLVAGPATVLSGFAFPLAAHARARVVGGAARGSGQVGAANTAGAIVGSLLAGFFLLPALGVVGAMAAIAVAVAASGAMLLDRSVLGRLGIAAVASLAVGGLAWRGASLVALHADVEQPGDRVLFAREGAQASVRVFEHTTGPVTIRRIAIDGQSIASTGAAEVLVKEVVLGHLPFLLHPGPRRVGLIGLGSGITLGAIAAHPDVEQIVCAEIVPEVWAAARYFAQETGGVLDDPRLRRVVGDGLQLLRGTSDRFDAIVGDEKVSLHSAANGTFFSRDYYLLIHDRLAPGGLFVQWVPLLLPIEDQRTVLRSFLTVFPDGIAMTLGRFGFVQIGGLPTPALSLERAAGVLARDDIRRALVFPLLDLTDPTFLAATAVARGPGLAAFVGAGPLQTADRPVLDYGIARWDFRFETYAARASGTIGAFADIVAAFPSPWLDAHADVPQQARARRALHGLLEAQRRELVGDVPGALAALAEAEEVPTLGPTIAGYRAHLVAMGQNRR